MTYQADVNVGGLVPTTNRRKYVTHKIKEGDNLYRILPPFGTNHKGLPFAEVSLHWFSTLDDTGKPKQRPLRCSYAVERFCPVCEEANDLYKEKESLLAEYIDEDTKKVRWDVVPEEVGAKHKQLKNSFDAVKVQRGYFYNALDASGVVGVLRLPKTAATKLGEQIKKAIQTYGFNPLSLENGAVFNIIQKKTGPKNYNVEYSVEFVMKSITGPDGVQLKITTEQAPKNVMDNYETLAYDVHAMYPAVTAAELQRAMIGDAILWTEMDAKKKAKAEATTAQEQKPVDPVVATPKTPTPTPTPEAKAEVVPEVVVESKAAPVPTAPKETPVNVESTVPNTSAVMTSDEDAELARLREELKV